MESIRLPRLRGAVLMTFEYRNDSDIQLSESVRKDVGSTPTLSIPLFASCIFGKISLLNSLSKLRSIVTLPISYRLHASTGQMKT
jgi:hypothetical protein